MSNIQAINPIQNQVKPLDPAAVEAVLLGGDLSRLTPAQRVDYYQKVCLAVGLNPLTKPFDYLQLNGKLVLYANKGCAEQLRAVHKISIRIADKQKLDDVYIVTAEAADPAARRDSATGVVNLTGLKGEQLANALMKAETKAKRRVTLSICGLNMLDDAEVESVKGARRLDADEVHSENAPARIVADQPGEDEGDQTKSWGYIIPFGQWKNKSLEQVAREFGTEKMLDYCDYLRDSAAKKGKDLTPPILDFISNVEDFVRVVDGINPKEDGGPEYGDGPDWDQGDRDPR